MSKVPDAEDDLSTEEPAAFMTEVQVEEKESGNEETATKERTPEYNDNENEFENETTGICETGGLPQTLLELRMADEDYDTDLDDEDDADEDESITNYQIICEQLGLAPVEYFLRNMKDRHITMRYRGLGPDATKAIALSLRDNVTLERLDISGNWIGVEGARPICRLLEENDYITDIVLAENKIGSAGGLYVAKMIQLNSGLTRIDLSGNELDDKCAEALASALEVNKPLRELNLSHNNFTEVGAQFLGPAIGANENLDVLNLSWNHLRESGGVEIAKGLKDNFRLKVFNLSWNGLASQGGLALADAMAVNQSLEELDISGNRLTQAVAERVAKVIATNDSLKMLKMGNNLITSAGAIALASAINNAGNCDIHDLDLTDVPVDYEFQRTIDDIIMKRPNFTVKHGPVMRAGNTADDLCKPGIDVDLIKKQPVVVLKEHIIVNDVRVFEILKKYDKDNSQSIAVKDFLTALEELAVPYDNNRLKESLMKFHGGETGKIYFGSFVADDHTISKPEENVT